MALDDFFNYLKANTPAESKIPQTELASQLWNGFNNNPQNTRTKDSIVNFATNSPIAGDLLSGMIGAGQVGKGFINDIQSLKQPTAQGMVHQMADSSYGEGAANMIGLIPGIPALGGIIKEIPAPVWKGSKKTIKVGIDPTNEELDFLSAIERQNTAPQSFGDLRLLKPTEKDSPYYFWPASDAMHNDVGAHFELDPAKYIKGLLDKD